MRIISGIHKGRKITAPNKLPVRPTTDRAKESLFNILRNHFIFSQIKVLDLFSGTGNIAYEFVSRGTPELTAVDEHIGCVRFIADTASTLNMPIATIKANVYDYLRHNQEKFDVIFADPPYDLDDSLFQNLIESIFENNRLNENGMLVIEHRKNTDLSTANNFYEVRNYGSSAFSFFKVL